MMLISNNINCEGIVDKLHLNAKLLLEFTWGEIKARYSRSVLGPLWLVLTTAISALGLSYVWSILFNQDKATFIPFLTTGLVVWQFILMCITEAPNCFNTYGSILKNYSHSILIYPLAIVMKNFIIFLHNCLIIFVVLMIYPPNLGWDFLLIIPGIILAILNLTVMVIIIAIIGARYKDFGPAINSLMTIIFFLSPVMYKPVQLGIKEFLVWVNPLSYIITAIREPLIGNSAPLFVYIVMLGMLLTGGMIAWFLISRYRYRIVYWV